MHPAPGETALKLRHKTFYSVMYVVAGALFLLGGLLSLTNGSFSFAWIPGILFTIGGILSFTMPAYSYEYATGALHAHTIFGYKVRAYGAPKGEQLWYDGQKLLRIAQNGKQRKVNLKICNVEDANRLVHLLVAQQQQQAPQQPQY